MNSLDGLSYTSNNLSGLSVGNFDNINSVTFQTEIPNQNILYLQGLTGNVQQQIDNVAGGGSSIPSISYDSSTNTTTFSGILSFANNASIGIVENAIPTAPKTISVKNRKNKSSKVRARGALYFRTQNKINNTSTIHNPHPNYII